MGPVFMTSLAHFTSMTWYSGSRGIRYTIGALIIAYTILGALYYYYYYTCSIIYPQTLF